MVLTVRRSSWDSGPRRVVGQPGIRTPRCRMPTNQLQYRVLVTVSTYPSTRLVLYIPVFLITSGARYSGVPHSVYVSSTAVQWKIPPFGRVDTHGSPPSSQNQNR